MRRTVSLLIALPLLAFPAAAHAGAGLSRPLPYRAAAPTTVTVGLVGRPENLNPLLFTSQSAADILSATSDGLLRYAPTNWPGNDQHYAWRPDLLASMPVLTVQGPPGPQAAVTIVYRLRPGLRWSDGAPLTAQDIRFTWQAVMQAANGAYQAGYNQITAIDTPSATTAVVHLKGTYAAWQTLFSALLPYHVLHGRITNIARDRAYNLRPLATGPYAVAYDRGGRIVLRRNPFYQGQDGPKGQVERIVVRCYKDSSGLLAALRSHQVTIADGLELSAQTLHRLQRAGWQVKSVPGLVFDQFTFNLYSPTTQQLSVRRAFYLALNRQAISQRLFGGRWEIATTDQAPFSWAFSPKVPVVRQNIAAARRLLQASGWQRGPGGYFQQGGQPLTLRVSMTRSPMHKALIEAVMRQEALAGIRVVPSYAPAGALFGPVGLLAQGHYQVAEFGLVDGVDPNDAALFSSGAGNRYAQGVDFSGYQNALVNALLQDALVRMHTAPRARDYRQVQMAVYRDLPMVPLFFQAVETVYNPRLLSRITVNDLGGSLWTANRWHVR